MPTEAELKQEITALHDDLTGFKGELSGLLEKQREEIKAHGKTTEETGKQLAEAHKRFADSEKSLNDMKTALEERMDKIEKRLERPDQADTSQADARKSAGQLFVESEALKGFLAMPDRKGIESEHILVPSRSFGRKAIGSAYGSGSGAALIQPYVDPTLVPYAEPSELTIFDFLNVVDLNQATNSVQYVKESSRTALKTELAAAVSATDTTATLKSVAGIIPGSELTVEDDVMTVDAGGVNRTTKVVTFTAGFGDDHAINTEVTSDHFAHTPEGEETPEGAIEYEAVTAGLQSLVRWIPVTRQMLSDYPMIRNLIDTDLRREHDEEREYNVLNGGGTRQLEGFMNLTTALTYSQSSGSAGDTKLDAIRRAATKLYIRRMRPNGCLVHPTDKEEIDLLKGEDGHYLFVQLLLANGVGSIQQIPLAQTAEMTYETFLMADFQRAATLYRRQMTEIFVGESGEDFKKRLTTILAESREHLAHKRPSAVVKGSFDGPPSS